MTSQGALLGVMLLAGLVAAQIGPAESADRDRCPFRGNDACDEWETQELEKELAAMIADPRPAVPMETAIERQARADFVAAHTHWLGFRDHHCRAIVSLDVISARTKRGQMAGCLLNMTWHLREELIKHPRFQHHAR